MGRNRDWDRRNRNRAGSKQDLPVLGSEEPVAKPPKKDPPKVGHKRQPWEIKRFDTLNSDMTIDRHGED